MLEFTQQSVHIHRLKLWCIIGIHPHERVQEQLLIVDVRMETDFSRAAASENIEDALNYSTAAKTIRQFAQNGRFKLLETLAQHLAAHLMENFAAKTLFLAIQKPQALAASDGSGVSLCVRRKTT